MWPICSAAEALSPSTFSPRSVTCRLGQCLCDRMINRPIRGRGKGPRQGGGWMVPAAPRSAFKLWLLPPPLLLIIAESHSAAGKRRGSRGLASWVSTPWGSSLAGWCVRLFDVLVWVAALRSAVTPAGFPDALVISWQKLPRRRVNVCIFLRLHSQCLCVSEVKHGSDQWPVLDDCWHGNDIYTIGPEINKHFFATVLMLIQRAHLRKKNAFILKIRK